MTEQLWVLPNGDTVPYWSPDAPAPADLRAQLVDLTDRIADELHLGAAMGKQDNPLFNSLISAVEKEEARKAAEEAQRQAEIEAEVQRRLEEERNKNQ